MIELRDIMEARERIRDSIYLSPCAHSETFSQLTGNDMYLKLDNLQMTGSFKERGALNRILALTEEEQARGVIAASAGNHAQAVSYHATRRGIRAVIVMPVCTPLVKVTATRGYGGEVVLHGDNYDEAYQEAVRRCGEEKLTLLHAFDDDAIIAGQGSLGLELLEQCPGLEAIVVPIGGGGLIGGIGCAVKSLNPAVRIVGVETRMVPSMKAALEKGEPVTVPPGTTIADGIAVRRAGNRTLPLVAKYVDEIVTVEEEEIANAILVLLEREKTLAEGAGAAGMAALLQRKTSLVGKRTAVVICGGNIDVTLLSRIIERGLVKDGRLVRLRILIPDRPGALQELTRVIAIHRANIVQMTHDRAYFGVHLGDTLLDITLETRGPEHVTHLIAGIRAAGYQEERVM
ncbi:MAG: threonine ammonia-lyase [Acidobacteriota bacterium]|nr:threonine ammonia-lyase [Acidobacteriota bacterium]